MTKYTRNHVSLEIEGSLGRFSVRSPDNSKSVYHAEFRISPEEGIASAEVAIECLIESLTRGAKASMIILLAQSKQP